jgi:hypothetical protein
LMVIGWPLSAWHVGWEDTLSPTCTDRFFFIGMSGDRHSTTPPATNATLQRRQQNLDKREYQLRQQSFA